MQSTPIRNPVKDHLLTPENSVIAFIDYQPEQFQGVNSIGREELLMNVTGLGKIAHDFNIPFVVTTVGVEMGVNQPTIFELMDILPEHQAIDRTTLNSWEDPEFLSAILATGRKNIIMSGLWTEVCVAFPSLDAIKDGYNVFPVVDAIGGVSKASHEAAVQRMIQAGAIPVTTLALACEMQRDWARGDGNTLRHIMRWYFGELRHKGIVMTDHLLHS
jgi:nicotinamidase-related amidase